MIGYNVGSAPSLDGSDIEGALAEHRIVRQRDAPQTAERVQQLFDGRFTQLWIRRVRHAPPRHDLVAQRSLGSQRELALGGLAVDQIAAAAAVPCGGQGSRTVALLAYHEQERHAAL